MVPSLTMAAEQVVRKLQSRSVAAMCSDPFLPEQDIGEDGMVVLRSVAD